MAVVKHVLELNGGELQVPFFVGRERSRVSFYSRRRWGERQATPVRRRGILQCAIPMLFQLAIVEPEKVEKIVVVYLGWLSGILLLALPNHPCEIAPGG